MTHSSPKKFIILDTERHIRNITDYLDWLIPNLSNDHRITNTRTTAKQIASAMINFHVDSRSAFKFTDLTLVNQYMEIIYCNSVNKINKDELTRVKAILEDSPLKHIEDDIALEISAYIKLKTYTSWSVVEYGGISGLIEGEDHRIKEWHELKDDNRLEETVLTLDYSNLVSYLYSVFMDSFWKDLTPEIILGNYLRLNPTADRMEVTNAMVRLQSLMQHPRQLVVACICEVLTQIYPGLHLSDSLLTPRFNDDVYCYLGINNIANFRRDYVTKVVNVFTLNHIDQRIDKDKNYLIETTVDLNNSNEDESVWIISIYETTVPEQPQREKELLESLLNGDYLPEDQRRQAEIIYQERYANGTIVSYF